MTWLTHLGVVGEMLSYPFMVRAFVVGTLVALCASQIGITLVIQRFSMMGDGLSHVAFGAIAISLLLHMAPLTLAVPVVIAAAFVILKLVPMNARTGDRAIAMLSSSALALGITAVSMTQGFNVDAESILFGSILGLSDTDLWVSAAVTLFVMGTMTLFGARIFSLIFDLTFARVAGEQVGRLTSLIALMTAMTVVTGMHIMGALLISSLIVFPASTAMLLHVSYRHALRTAALLAIASVWVGLTISYVASVPAGAAIVLTNAAFYLAAHVFKRLRP